MQDQNPLPTLVELDDWQLVDDDQDIRGWPLLSAEGDRLGVIGRMLIDRDNERVAAVVLEDGRTIPVEQIDILEDRVVMAGTATGAMLTDATLVGDTSAEQRIPIVEENLEVGKRVVDRGHIRVRSRVVEVPAEAQVTLREKHVEISRREIDEPVRDADAFFRDRTVEMTATSEEAVVAKEARIVEEVVVRKDADQRIETIEDTVRHTEVDIQDERAPR